MTTWIDDAGASASYAHPYMVPPVWKPSTYPRGGTFDTAVLGVGCVGTDCGCAGVGCVGTGFGVGYAGVGCVGTGVGVGTGVVGFAGVGVPATAADESPERISTFVTCVFTLSTP